MNKLEIIISFIAVVVFHSSVEAATITAEVAGGEWTAGGSWVGGFVPSNGDDVIIPDGSTITITDQIINFNGTITIESGGTLSLVDTGVFFGFPVFPFATLIMDGTSSILIDTGGQIISSSEGAPDSNGITVGTNLFAYYPGFGIGANPQTGPATIDETTIGGPLPIRLIFFNANVATNFINLTWATAIEENFDYFALERSADGENFIEIAQISGAGYSVSRIDYSYTDELPMQGISYYRIRSVDFDGYTEVFDYAIIETEGIKEDFSVYPNPVVNGVFNIQTNFDIEDPAELLIYNNVGRVEATYTLSDWLSTIEKISLHPGNYIFKLATPDGVIVHRVLVK